MQVEMLRSQMGPSTLQPLALFLVPTRELGAQLALLIWQLLGGNDSSRNPGDPANMFTYEVGSPYSELGIPAYVFTSRFTRNVNTGNLESHMLFEWMYTSSHRCAGSTRQAKKSSIHVLCAAECG